MCILWCDYLRQTRFGRLRLDWIGIGSIKRANGRMGEGEVSAQKKGIDTVTIGWMDG